MGTLDTEQPDEIDAPEEDPVASQDVEPPFVGPEKFGTFAGVFTPTILTVLGVIMYLRLGWVVGNAGLALALLIILLAFMITITTGLSMSSITTNIRIGGGGAYSIISQSLGIEVGGSIGIPLYIAQALAVTMYIFGFREGWLYIFPDHPAFLVDVAVFAVLFAIAYLSSSLAFRVQYVIMAVIGASLISVAGAAVTGSMTEPVQWLGSFPGEPESGFQGTSFWVVFAVFFPAATGILAGANMSGDLKDPRKSIPLGTMAAIGFSLIIYLLLAYWLARSATPAELASNYTIMIDRALWGPAVLGGLLGATFSSALASLVGAPRILEALGVHRIVPGGEWLAERNARGEPGRALILTGGLVLAGLLLRSLNAVAPLLTMFFLITYAMINVVVLIEQQLGLISFRPLMRIPAWVPLLGTVGCVATMFIVNPSFGMAAVVLVVLLYIYLARRALEAPYGDVRSGLFLALSEWSAKKIGDLRGSQDRAWRANLLVPVSDPQQVKRNFHFLQNLARPKGMVKVLGIARRGQSTELTERLTDARHALADEGLFVTSSAMGSTSFSEGVVDAMQTLRGTLFRPTVLFLELPASQDQVDRIQPVIPRARELGMGMFLYREHPEAGLGRRKRVTVWLTAPDGWQIDLEDIGDIDLALLTAVKLRQNWGAQVKLVAAAQDPADADRAQRFLDEITTLARLPTVSTEVQVGALEELLAGSDNTDLNIVPLPAEADLAALREASDASGASTVFTQDSGKENALA